MDLYTPNIFLKSDIIDRPLAEQFVYACQNNVGLASKYLLKTELFPFQICVLAAMWDKPFPLLVANRGFGKCNSANTYISTSYGFFRIGDLFSKDALIENKYPSNFNVFGENGFMPSEYMWKNDKSETIKLITSFGFNVETTPDHKVRVVRNGEISWIENQDIEVGDFVVIDRTPTWFPDTNNIKEDLAYLFGCLVGDGGYTVRGRITLTTSDSFIINTAMKTVKKYFNKEFIKNNYDKYGYNLYSVDLWDRLFNEYGFNSSECGKKDMPKCILSAPKKSVASFLRGLFDTDGYCNKNGSIVEYCSKSKKLVESVQFILTRFGIISKTFSKFNKKYKTNYYYLNIYGKDLRLFYNEIGFGIQYKKDRLKKCFNTSTNSNKNIIPRDLILQKLLSLREKFMDMYEFGSHEYIYDRQFWNPFSLKTYNMTYEKLDKILELTSDMVDDDDRKFLLDIYNKNYFYDRVKEKKSGFDYTYDIHIPNDHSYISNGLISHNTFLLAVYATLRAIFDQGSKIVLVSKSYRQCLTKDALLLTDEGMIPISKVTEKNLVHDGKHFQKINGIWENPEQSTIKITTQNGYTIEGHPDHKVLCNGMWRKLENLRNDDEVNIYCSQFVFGKSNPKLDTSIPEVYCSERMPEEVSEDLAALIGKILTNNFIYDEKWFRYVHDEKENPLRVKRLLRSSFNTIADTRYISKKHSCVYREPFFFQFLLNNGFDPRERTIPEFILKAPQEIIAAFLKSYISDCSEVKETEAGVPYIVIYGNHNKNIETIHTMLLNFGIVSKLEYDKYGSAKINIKDTTCVLNYVEHVGFEDPTIKHKIIEQASEHSSPNSKKKNSVQFNDILQNTFLKNDISYRQWGKYRHRGFIEYHEFEDVLSDYDGNDFDLFQLDNTYRDKISKIENSKNVTYDLEVDTTHRYFASGFVNHNSLFIFDEITKFYNKSQILRDLCPKPPVKATTASVLNIGDSTITAIPLGEGKSVRGIRATVILCDEYASMNKEVFDVVVRNFTSVAGDPVATVKKRARIDDLKMRGLPIPAELRLASNQIVLSGTAWYQDNHFYETYLKYRNIIDASYSGSVGDIDSSVIGSQFIDYKDYIVFHFNYTHLPKAYIDEKQLAQAKLTMTPGAFAMEWESKFQTNSDGFFKYKDIANCKSSGGDRFSVELSGNPTARYVLGLDPSSGGHDNFGLAILKLGQNVKYISKIMALSKKSFPEAMEIIKELLMKFNFIKLGMDTGGGGFTIRDLLKDDRIMEGVPLIYEEDPNLIIEGQRNILEMVNFTPTWILKANQDLQSDLHHRRLLFPADADIYSPVIDEAEEEIDELVRELLSIEMTLTKSGIAHFDTPSRVITEGNAKRITSARKDRYSALLIANYVANRYMSGESVGRYSGAESFGGGWMEDVLSG